MEFRVGQEYSCCDWFTGGRVIGHIVVRGENKVTMDCITMEADGVHKFSQSFDVELHNGREQIVLQEYKGEKHLLVAEEGF